MNLCNALKEGRNQLKAIRLNEWASDGHLAWYHGMDNQLCWYNSDPDSPCMHKTGERVAFSMADFIDREYEIHDTIHYHGDIRTEE